MATVYRYLGPLSALPLPDGSDIALCPGRAVELPADNAYVATLVARRYLGPYAAGIGVMVVGDDFVVT